MDTLYIAITKQSVHSGTITRYEGSWDERNHGGLSPAEAVRSFHQFSEGYEPHGWIADPDSCTAAEFDARYAAGQRLFWLTNRNENIVVEIEEPPAERSKRPTVWLTKAEHQKLLDARDLLGDLTAAAVNHAEGRTTAAEFKALATAFDGYETTGDKAKTDALVTAVLDAHEARVEKGAPEG